jgi:23S rRNA (uracil1939-C5)-methyltransferase
MKRNDELELTLQDFAFEGKSIARVEGMVVFVQGAVPGDTVRVRILKAKKSFAEAVAVEVLSPSPLRVEPRCRHFGVCGGCRWQNVRYDAQLAFKRQQVVDALERIGGFGGVQVAPTLGSQDEFYYRNKMEFSFGQRWRSKQELGSPADPADFALGLHIPERFDRVLDVDECWLQSETSAAIVNSVRRFAKERGLDWYSTVTHTGYLRNLVIRTGAATGELMVNLVTLDHRPAVMQALTRHLLEAFPVITTIVNNTTARKSQVALGDEEHVYHGPGFIEERIGHRTYRISANSFFQTNTRQAERLYDTVRSMASVLPDDVVFDLYSGTGTIAFHLADDAREVVGIESSASAVADAGRNAQRLGVSNCTFMLGDLKETLTGDRSPSSRHPSPSVIVTDPPRAGMHEAVVREIAVLAPRRIVYVSCNPATQARDLALLCADRHFRITAVQPVDMFPHTYHIENVVALDRA